MNAAFDRCFSCGAALMGSWTIHNPGCSVLELIDEAKGGKVMNDVWKQHTDAALVDIHAAITSEGKAALEHLRDAANQIDAAIEAIEGEEAPER